MTRDEALERAKLIEKRLMATDFSNHIVIAKSNDIPDMFFFCFDPAIMHKEEEYYLVFPEHHETQVFHQDEFAVIEYQPVEK